MAAFPIWDMGGGKTNIRVGMVLKGGKKFGRGGVGSDESRGERGVDV